MKMSTLFRIFLLYFYACMITLSLSYVCGRGLDCCYLKRKSGGGILFPRSRFISVKDANFLSSAFHQGSRTQQSGGPVVGRAAGLL
jgi:hypothetical protein